MEIIFNLKILLRQFFPVAIIVLGLLCPTLNAQEGMNLLSLYQEALRNDSLLSSARFQNEATQELITQGKSLFLPSISVNASFDKQDKERKFLTSSLPSNDLLSGKKTNYNTYDYGITVKQPLSFTPDTMRWYMSS